MSKIGPPAGTDPPRPPDRLDGEGLTGMSHEDWVLMHRVAAGDEDAVADLYDRFSTLVFKVACQLLPSRAEAEDAVQEVFSPRGSAA